MLLWISIRLLEAREWLSCQKSKTWMPDSLINVILDMYSIFNIRFNVLYAIDIRIVTMVYITPEMGRGTDLLWTPC